MDFDNWELLWFKLSKQWHSLRLDKYALLVVFEYQEPPWKWQKSSLDIREKSHSVLSVVPMLQLGRRTDYPPVHEAAELSLFALLA